MQDQNSEQKVPHTWDEAVAMGLLTQAMAEALVTPDSLTEQISDIARSLEERQRRLQDR